MRTPEFGLVWRFNPRLHAGGDLEPVAKVERVIEVSIHASTQEATLTLRCWMIIYWFQSTPPRRRRRVGPDTKCLRIGFNPRLHAGGDSFLPGSSMNEAVSIHASTQEATSKSPFP